MAQRLSSAELVTRFIDETMSRSMLFCVTEMNTREEIEKLVASLQEILA